MKFKDLLSFSPNLITNGEFHFESPENFAILFKNFEKIKKRHNKILVCFTAAVSDRTTKSGPFFSGAKVSDELDIPLISLSDYVITKNQNLGLAWYTGDYTYSFFQKDIAHFLDNVSSFFEAELIMLGGSGGGFASMAIGSFLTCNCHILTMNPQIIIENYFYSAVESYIKYSFPHDEDLLLSKNFSKIFLKYNIVNNLSKIQFNDNIKIIYFQNKKDKHHIEKHFSKFIIGKELYPIGDNSFIYNNIGFYLGEWGASHTPPSLNIVITVLRLLCNNMENIMLLRALENGLNGINVNNSDIIFLTKHDYRLKLKVMRDVNRVYIDLTVFYRGVKIDIPDIILFAVYIMDKNNNIILRLPYQRCISELIIEQTEIRLKVFAKDSFGNKITTVSELI